MFIAIFKAIKVFKHNLITNTLKPRNNYFHSIIGSNKNMS